MKISARTHSRGKWERLKCRPKQASLLAIGFLTFKTSVAEVSAPISETLAKASASQQGGVSLSVSGGESGTSFGWIQKKIIGRLWHADLCKL